MALDVWTVIGAAVWLSSFLTMLWWVRHNRDRLKDTMLDLLAAGEPRVQAFENRIAGKAAGAVRLPPLPDPTEALKAQLGALQRAVEELRGRTPDPVLMSHTLSTDLVASLGGALETRMERILADAPAKMGRAMEAHMVRQEKEVVAAFKDAAEQQQQATSWETAATTAEELGLSPVGALLRRAPHLLPLVEQGMGAWERWQQLRR